MFSDWWQLYLTLSSQLTRQYAIPTSAHEHPRDFFGSTRVLVIEIGASRIICMYYSFDTQSIECILIGFNPALLRAFDRSYTELLAHVNTLEHMEVYNWKNNALLLLSVRQPSPVMPSYTCIHGLCRRGLLSKTARYIITVAITNARVIEPANPLLLQLEQSFFTLMWRILAMHTRHRMQEYGAIYMLESSASGPSCKLCLYRCANGRGH